MEILSQSGAEIFGRWVHYFAGVAWIGMLWFFNFVQGGWFKTTSADTKNNAVKEMVPNALWWFRFGALWTWISGMYLLWHRATQIGMANLGNSSWTIWILLGTLMGTFMFLNVWLVIWPAQKIIIGKANGEDLGDAAAAAARAGVASRTNTLFSIPLLFMMGAASHFNIAVRETGVWPAFGVCAVLITLIEINAVGPKKMGPMASPKGVITSGCVLLLVQYLIVDLMCK